MFIPNILLLLYLHFWDISVSDLSSLCLVAPFSSVFFILEIFPFSLFITVTAGNHLGTLY